MEREGEILKQMERDGVGWRDMERMECRVQITQYKTIDDCD